MALVFHIVRITASPAIGEWITIRVALVSACFIAFSDSLRRICEDADVGVGGPPLEIVGGPELLQLGFGFLERQLVLLGLDLRRSCRS